MISMIFSWDLVSLSLSSFLCCFCFTFLCSSRSRSSLSSSSSSPSTFISLVFFYAIPIYSSDPPLLYIYSCVRPWQSTQVWFPSCRCNVVAPLSPYTSYLRRYHGRLNSLFPRTNSLALDYPLTDYVLILFLS